MSGLLYHKVRHVTLVGMSYISVSLTESARDALRNLTLELVTPVGRRLTMSEVLIAAVELAHLHRAELLSTLRGETPDEG